jgi:hypothetical protein
MLPIRPRPGPRGPTPTWLVVLSVLLLAGVAVLWPLLTGLTWTEWMRDASRAVLPRRLSLSTPVQAPGCSLATLQGAYGGLGTGTNVSSPLVPPGPLAIVNVLRFDGRGGVTVLSETMSFNGEVRRLEAPVTASYEVRADCTGVLRFEAPNVFDMVILEGGAEVVAIHATAGFVHTLVLKRQSAR